MNTVTETTAMTTATRLHRRDGAAPVRTGPRGFGPLPCVRQPARLGSRDGGGRTLAA